MTQFAQGAGRRAGAERWPLAALKASSPAIASMGCSRTPTARAVGPRWVWVGLGGYVRVPGTAYRVECLASLGRRLGYRTGRTRHRFRC